MAFALIVSIASPASATPVADKREQARLVKAQVDDLDLKVEIATEEFNEARHRRQQLTAEMEETRARIAEQTAIIDDLQSSLDARVASLYRAGRLSFLEVLLGASDFEQFAATWELLRDINERDALSVAALREARARTEEAREQLAVQEAEAKRVVERMAENKAFIESRLAERRRMLAGLEAEIARIEAAERARAEAAARTFAVSRSGTQWVPDQSFPPPTRAARSEVVSIAMRYLGAPYRWGASGPNSFDCSGFTLFVYRQVGVSLPHSSRAQFRVGERVARSDLQPGDLVFFGSPIHHVGIYVGGGRYIHSPRTGDVVKVSSLSSRGMTYTGATRP
ncbi:MAG TPA: NlpC/P60 family protein [Coriobacteriia bacterium]|nr:NlpC/P60 family protein [Coriobacteriia bacterium]